MNTVKRLALLVSIVLSQLAAQVVNPPFNGSGGSGSVTSVVIAGTALQITATGTCTITSTGTCTLSIPSVFTLPGSILGSSTADFSTATSFKLPVGAAPTVNAIGQLAFDSNLWGASRGSWITYDGTAATALVGVLVSDTPTNGQTLKWNTGGTITWEDSASAGVTSLSSLTGAVLMSSCFGTSGGDTITFVNTCLSPVIPFLATANTYAAGATQIVQPSVTLPAIQIVGGAPPSSLLSYPGAVFVTAAGLYGGTEGTNANIFPYVAGSGIAPPSFPGAGLATWAGSTFALTSTTMGTGVLTFLTTPSCSNFFAAVTGETGSGACVGANTPTLVTPVLGAATATSILASGNVDGTAPLTVTTGTSATLGGTFKSGYTINEHATAATAVAYTLPTAAAGLQYCVGNGYNGSAANTGVLTLNTSASGQFMIFTDGTLTASGGNVTSGGAGGDFACVVGVDATHWQFRASQGSWTKH